MTRKSLKKTLLHVYVVVWVFFSIDENVRYID